MRSSPTSSARNQQEWTVLGTNKSVLQAAIGISCYTMPALHFPKTLGFIPQPHHSVLLTLPRYRHAIPFVLLKPHQGLGHELSGGKGSGQPLFFLQIHSSKIFHALAHSSALNENFLVNGDQICFFGGTSKPPSNQHRCTLTSGLLNTKRNHNKITDVQTCVLRRVLFYTSYLIFF